MAKDWGGKTYDEDFYEINAWGERQSNEKDWKADNDWHAANPTQNAPTTGGNGGSSTSQTTYAPAPRNQAYVPLEDAVMKRTIGDIGLDGSVDQNDPVYQQGIQANQLQTDRAADRARASAVQRRAATGTGTSGAVDTDINKFQAEQAYQDKGFEANLMNQFRTQNLDRMGRALTLGAGMLTAEQQRMLQDKLTTEQYNLQREGYDVQRDLARDDINFRRDALGQQGALSQAELDQRAMLALLGG